MDVALALIHVMETNLISDKSKLALYKASVHSNSCWKQLYLSNKTERFIYKGGCSIHEDTRIEAFKKGAGLAYR